MKKSLLALAAMGAFAGAAQAQSSVTVYGLIDMGVTSITTETTVRNSTTSSATATDTGNNGRMSGSRLGFRGVEDLGGGTTAGFTLEMAPDFTEQVNGIHNGTRLGFLSLSNKQIGGLHIGRQVSSTKLVNDTFTAFGNASFETGNVAGAGFNSGSTAADTAVITNTNRVSTQGGLTNFNGGERISNLIRYTTPALIPGLTAQASLYKMANSTATPAAAIIGTANGEGTDFGIRYTQGAIDVMAAYNVYNTTNNTTTDFTAKNTVMSLGASYDAKVVKAFVAYNKRDFDSSTATVSQIKFTDLTVGLNAPLGKANLLLAYSNGSDDSSSQKNDKMGYQVGAVYNLSKRTNIYAVYGTGKVEMSSGTPTNSKVSASGTAIGVRHTF